MPFIRRHGAWIGFLVLALVVTVLTSDFSSGTFESRFISSRNLTNLIRQASINGVLASGMTMVILTGGIDLSIGSIVALAGVFTGISQVTWGWMNLGLTGAVGSGLLTIGIGGLCGLITGGLVAMLGIAPFVITLGMMVITRGLALIFSNGSGISPMGDDIKMLGDEYLSSSVTMALFAIVLISLFLANRKKLMDSIFPVLTLGFFAYSFLNYRGLPVPVLFLLLALGTSAFLLTHTTWGRCVFAIGSNEQAAHWAGVPIRTTKWLVYTAMGLFSGLAALLLTARLNSAVPTAGNLFELDAIAAVVIGGTSLKGGIGSVMGSFVGALTIATLNNGMDLLEVPSFYQMVLKGIIIIIAVALDRGQRQS